MTEWYAFSCRPIYTVEAADTLARNFDCDAFSVMQTPMKRLPRSNVRVPGDPVCVLPSYVFAGFDRPPNFLRIDRHRERTKYPVYPIRFAGQIKPLNRMNIAWITHVLPAPLHRHYDDPPATGAARFRCGDMVKTPTGPVRVEEVTGSKLRLDLMMLGQQVVIDAEEAEMAMTRVA